MTSGCVRVSGGKKGIFSKGSFSLCVCVTVHSCVHTCDQECIYVWEEGILPVVFFPEPLPVPPPPSTPLHTILKAGVRGFGLCKFQPTRGHRGEEPVFLYLPLYLPMLCLFPPLAECYCKPFSSYTPYPHISPSSMLVYLI